MAFRIESPVVELMVKVGCRPEEQAAPQNIRLQVHISGRKHPPACRSDLLKDTLDVEQVIGILEGASHLPHLLTLEHLASVLESKLLDLSPIEDLEWELRITKPRYGWTYVHSFKR